MDYEQLCALAMNATGKTSHSDIVNQLWNNVVGTPIPAPFMAHQMKRLAKRVPLGVALTGGYGYTTSGDIFLAFSTANPQAAHGRRAGWSRHAIFRTRTSTRSSTR